MATKESKVTTTATETAQSTQNIETKAEEKQTAQATQTAQKAASAPDTAAKEAPKKPVRKPAAKTKKSAKEPLVPEVVLQYNDNGEQQADLADIIAKVKALYVTKGRRESSIRSLKIYIKPQDWKAYYVINGSIQGEIDLFAE